MMKIISCIAAMAVCMAISGCIPRVDVDEKRAEYKSLQPTVSSYEEMSFEPISLSGDKNFEITSASPVFDFGPQDGVSHYKAFELPTTDSTYRVLIKSYQYAVQCLFCGSAYFYQTVKLLDETRKPVPIVRPEPAIFKLGGSYRREIALVIKPEDHAHYLVVHTTKQFVDAGDTHVQPAPDLFIAGPLPMMIPMGNMQTSAKGLPIGELDIALEPVE
ncbi:hypothetical protein FHS78_002286 [Parvibaculum indicum]|uniref:hypothetical protein n=1 Tax=Parvibaculum indicum TaxID=562969 RepID=UPI001420C711|nr:hypothetical protein [Parvibaculum indicum]NIJ41995.1 hypothetical protein [Parvibaculum indicum]